MLELLVVILFIWLFWQAVKLTFRIAWGAAKVIAVILFALVKSGLCNVLTAVLPLVFTRPILSITAFFQKGDDLP